MSALADAETKLRDLRWAREKALAMRAALARPNPLGFQIDLKVQGHFASSTTYNQTHSAEVDDALRAVIWSRLDDLLVRALDLIEAREMAAANSLLRIAVEVAAPKPVSVPA